MQVTFVKTVVVNETQFIDVLLIDGVKYTVLMQKTQEPNIFTAIKEEKGYTVDTILTSAPVTE